VLTPLPDDIMIAKGKNNPDEGHLSSMGQILPQIRNPA
jgi:hypothetical protein